MTIPLTPHHQISYHTFILYQSLKYFLQTIVMLEENLPYEKVDFVSSLYESFRKEHSRKQIKMTSKLLPHVCN